MSFKSQNSVTVLRRMFIRQMRNKKYRTENRLHLHQNRKHDWHVMKDRAPIRYWTQTCNPVPIKKASGGAWHGRNTQCASFNLIAPLKLPWGVLLIFAKFLEQMFVFLCPLSFTHSSTTKLPQNCYQLPLNYQLLVFCFVSAFTNALSNLIFKLSFPWTAKTAHLVIPLPLRVLLVGSSFSAISQVLILP